MDIKITQLNNGIRLITDRIPSMESAAVGVWAKVGSRNETEAENGMSHFLEHMAFKGTTTRSAVQIAEEIESVGGHMNAYTSREVTAYHVRVLKESVPLALDILSDILQHSTFDATEFERERQVIHQEIGQSNDTPDDIIFDYFYETAYTKQPIGRSILGTPESLDSFQPKGLQGYMQKHYTPENLVVSVSGNIEHEEIAAQVEKLFGAMQPSQSPSFPKATYQGGQFFKEKELEQVHLILGFEGQQYDPKKHYPCTVLSTLLGGGMSSRLFQEIREKRGLVYSIYSYPTYFRDSGLFSIYAGTGPKDVETLLPVMCEELKKATHSLTETELNRAKIQIRSSLLMALESPATRADSWAFKLLMTDEIMLPQTTTELVEKVTLDDVMACAEDIFSSAPTLVQTGPLKSPKSLDDIKSYLR